MWIVVYIEMIAETTEVGEIAQDYTLKNENRSMKMLTTKK